ncbi:MAG: glutamine synthetase adenylyltransferase, partial [Planctomycetaceae bacterium]|nr:glutamine synthetase adenylyltransferase [Planctomycetaceae bacterium]
MYKQTADWLLRADIPGDPARRTRVVASMKDMGFPDPGAALSKWESVVEVAGKGCVSGEMLAFLLATMSQTAAPETSLRNFFRCVCNWNQPAALFALLEQRPRAIEMLVRLFVNSQFLTELLLKHPEFLERLTESRHLSEVRDRGEFLQDMRKAASGMPGTERFDAVRRIQRWEVLRIAACDCFGLMDLKRVTLQLSLLADATVQALLELLVESDGGEGLPVDTPAAPAGFAVLALGKLGGEELNYSSDIDLVFLGESSAMEVVRIGQQLVRELGRTTPEGFLYRVDMRLRPWGASGPLVCDVVAYREYLDTQASPWELQAMVKARVIAGDMDLGNAFLADVNRRLVEYGKNEQAQTIREMKRRIEVALPRRGRDWAEVKSGVGSIRDIEFVTQYLQLRHAQDHPAILDTNTLRSLAALAAAGCLRSDEYRKLSTGYLLLRAIEHSLQLMHNKQVHTLPEDDGELTYLARRLDFPDAEQFVTHYVEHSREIREVFERILGEPSSAAVDRTIDVELIEPHYLEVYDSRQRAGHQRLLAELERFGSVVVEPVRLEEDRAEVTIVAFDGPGLLSAICGLLVVHGVDIVSGHVVTIDVGDGPSRCVDTFQVSVPAEVEWDVLWAGYHGDIVNHMDRIKSGSQEEAFACLTRSVADHVPRASEPTTSLLPVEIEIDNETSAETTVLTIRADDTTGFLYECAHALSLAGISIRQVVVETRGERVRDRLEVVDKDGGKLRDAQRLQELKTMVVLIKHFTHLLPHSPNPERALRQFRELLVGLLKLDDWTTRVASLEDPKVLVALARVLGVSAFLWQD